MLFYIFINYLTLFGKIKLSEDTKKCLFIWIDYFFSV